MELENQYYIFTKQYENRALQQLDYNGVGKLPSSHKDQKIEFETITITQCPE